MACLLAVVLTIRRRTGYRRCPHNPVARILLQRIIAFRATAHALQRSIGGIVPRHISPRPVMEE
jgi:hypothetical protein